MKLKLVYFLALMCMSISAFSATTISKRYKAISGTLSGKITDKTTGSPVAGATIYIPDLKIGASTDSAGKYSFKQLPRGTYLVQVRAIGYASITQKVNFSKTETLDFQLLSSTYELSDVVITALGNTTIKQRAAVPVTVVTHDMLTEQASTNVIDALAKQPGLNEITEGPGISKPVINGLGYNRVLTLMDGERQEDFQWGDEHGVLIDPYAVYDAEIIRGAASLQYGANAVAGVVSFKSEPFRENGTVQGTIQSEYQTNNGLIGNSIDISGNNNGLVWDLRGSYEEAHSYSDPADGYVWGTAFNQANLRAVIGLNKKWGYSHLTVSHLHRQIEVPDGNRDSSTRQFEFDVPIGAKFVNGVYVPGSGQIFPTKANFLSYNPDISGYQVLNHDEIWWQNSINVGNGHIGADIGYTASQRHEIDTGTVGEENMVVHDIPYSLKYQIEGPNSGLKLTTGLNGIYEFENNYAEPPPPYVGDFEIPNYHMFDIGGYGIVEKDFKALTISGGLRYDLRSINGQSMYLANYDTPQQTVVPAGTAGAYQQFPLFDKSYTGFSGSLGATYQLPDNNYVKLNVAKSYRAPAINELTSNELDPSNVFKLGDPNLKAEQGYEVDVAYGINTRNISFEVDGFYNYISNFIFADRISAANGADSIRLGAPVYKYTSNTAVLGGITSYFNIHPASAKWFELDNGFTYIYTSLLGQSDSTRHIPFTPAPRLTSELKLKLAEMPNSIIRGSFFKFGLEHDWAQNDIYSALYNELPSSPYTLFNTGVGTNFVSRKSKRVLCTVLINCTNLFDIAYIDHLSREQYFWAYNSVSNPTNFGATAAVVTKPSEGIYNMGRNIGFKLIIPIGIAGNKPTVNEGGDFHY
jgi:iron complex outermembrane receptor protein